MGSYKFKFEIISPLHIGSGSQLEPLNYLIKENALYAISFDRFILSLTDTERSIFESIIERSDLIGIRKYISQNIDISKEAMFSIEVTPYIRSHYEKNIDSIHNQLLVSPFLRTSEILLPYIPGSSIKGAIRTAVINSIAEKSGLPKPQNFEEERSFEANVLGYADAKSDPLRAFKVRDAFLKDQQTIVRYIRNVSMKKGLKVQSNEMPPFIFEVTHSDLTGKEVYFETTVSLDESLFKTAYLGKTFGLEQIASDCTAFYRDKMIYEHNKFFKNTDVEPFSKKILETTLSEKSFFLRIGRFSGVESVTLDKYRNPRPPGNKRVWGTSRNLADGKYPMGWVKATFIEV